MSLPKTTMEVFDQEEYANTFYCCEKDHPFVVFTTCYCPLCETREEMSRLFAEIENLEDDLDDCKEDHLNLVVKVKNNAPELLI